MTIHKNTTCFYCKTSLHVLVLIFYHINWKKKRKKFSVKGAMVLISYGSNETLKIVHLLQLLQKDTTHILIWCFWTIEFIKSNVRTEIKIWHMFLELTNIFQCAIINNWRQKFTLYTTETDSTTSVLSQLVLQRDLHPWCFKFFKVTLRLENWIYHVLESTTSHID
jgi:hypothetical protein